MLKILLLVQVCGPMQVSGVLALQEIAQDLVTKWGEANIHRQKYSQISMMMQETAGNKCVKITFNWSKYLGSTPWLESPNVQVAWDLGSQHLQEDPSILTGKLSMMSLVISLKVWVNGWIDAIIYHYQDCNELALLLLGSGNRWKWDLRSNSEVTIAELEPYTMWWGVDDFQFNDKSTFGQLWYWILITRAKQLCF